MNFLQASPSNMESVSSILLYCFLWTFFENIHRHPTFYASAATSITASAPLEQVEEGAILSVHCQVLELQEGHEVALFRTPLDGKTQRVSVGGVITVEEDRVFLAERQLNDGSIVYFLSVMEVTRNDQGSYKCQVFDPVEQTTVDENTVFIGVMYFPSELPVCNHHTPLQVMEGSVVIFNCTSERANPTVTLEWSSGGEGSTELKGTEVISGHRVTSMLRLTAKLQDSGAMFVCKATSHVFPGEAQRCHIGPLQVVPNPRGPPPPSPPHSNPTLTPNIISDNTRPGDFNTKDCAKVCSAFDLNSPVFKWIVTTTIAGIIALTFFIVVVVCMWKYYHIQDTSRNLYVTGRPQHQLSEQLYSELECKRGDNMTYMSLTKEDTKRLNQEFITKYGCSIREQQYEDKP